MESQQETQKVRLYSYSKVWNTENKIYSFQNLVLPAPVSPNEVLYFILIMGVIFVLSRIFTLLQTVPGVVTYIVFPYIITTYLRKKKLDGKNPIKYLIGYVRQLLFDKNTFTEGFEKHTAKDEKITLKWNCSYSCNMTV